MPYIQSRMSDRGSIDWRGSSEPTTMLIRDNSARTPSRPITAMRVTSAAQEACSNDGRPLDRDIKILPNKVLVNRTNSLMNMD